MTKKRRAERAGAISIVRRTRRRVLTDRAVRDIVRAAAKFGRRGGDGFSVVLVDDRELARLHARWLDDASRTDVITFDLGREGSGPVGELYVSAERALAVAAALGGSARCELALYLVHGVLHLCGYDDRRTADRRRMRRAEARVLERLGYGRELRPFE